MLLEAKRVALMGDSQAEGLGMYLRSLLAARGMELVFDETQSGITTNRYVSEYAVLAPRDLDLAIVVLGGNDTATPTYADTLRHAVSVIGGRASRILWIGPSYSTVAGVEQRHTAVRHTQASVLPKLGVTFRDPLIWQQGAAADRAPDGTHFRRDAYELQAEAVAIEAQSLLARPAAILFSFVVVLLAGLGTWWASRR